MLQVEQEKQFTHQALLRADTTAKAQNKRKLPDYLNSDLYPNSNEARCEKETLVPCNCEPATAALTNGTGTVTQNEKRTNLTISLYHVAAVVANISKELHSERSKNRNSCYWLLTLPKSHSWCERSILTVNEFPDIAVAPKCTNLNLLNNFSYACQWPIFIWISYH